MRKIIFIAVVTVALFSLSACQKNTGVSSAPTIVFKTTTGYQSADFNLQTYGTATVGVTCNETSTNDPLSKLVVYKTVNGSGGSTPFSEVDNLSGNDALLFSKDYTVSAGGNQGIVTYTFTIYTQSGASASCVINITVI